MRLRSLFRAGAAALTLLGTTPATADVQYVYDSAGRMIKAIYSNGVTITYRYDAAGNRTQIVTTNAPNAPPVAVNDTASVNASSSVNILVRANDSDPDSNSLIVLNVGAPNGGSAMIEGGQAHVRYTAPATAGVYTFTYTISDNAGGTDTAQVAVTVSSTNAAPVAVDDAASATVSLSQTIFVLFNDTDANGHTLTVTGVSNVTGGSASVPAGGGHVLYTAPATPGSYSFNYAISDGHGGTDTGLVTVVVNLGEQCVSTPENQCDLDP